MTEESAKKTTRKRSPRKRTTASKKPTQTEVTMPEIKPEEVSAEASPETVVEDAASVAAPDETVTEETDVTEPAETPVVEESSAEPAPEESAVEEPSIEPVTEEPSSGIPDSSIPVGVEVHIDLDKLQPVHRRLVRELPEITSALNPVAYIPDDVRKKKQSILMQLIMAALVQGDETSAIATIKWTINFLKSHIGHNEAFSERTRLSFIMELDQHPQKMRRSYTRLMQLLCKLAGSENRAETLKSIDPTAITLIMGEDGEIALDRLNRAVTIR